MTAPTWGHKPPPVPKPIHFNCAPPPELSGRCLYWLRRADQGNWRANRRFWEQEDEGRAILLGAFVWEVRNVIVPLLANLKEATSSSCARALGHDLKNCCAPCHAQWECDGEYMCDGYDVQARDLHTCCKAAIISGDLRDLVPWHVRLGARR
jgi:hypothetical protein